MNTSATFWNRLRFVQTINDNGAMASGPHAYAIDRDLFAFVAKPTKPECTEERSLKGTFAGGEPEGRASVCALNEMTFSAMAWVDDKSNRSQSACRRKATCVQTHPQLCDNS